MRKWLVPAAALVFCCAGGQSRANFTLSLSTANPGLAASNVSPPYATLMGVDNVDGTITISVTNNGEASLLGTLGFNLPDPASLSVISQTGSKADWVLNQSGGQMDGLGSYAEQFGPVTNSVNDRQASFSFTLSSSSGPLTDAMFSQNGGVAGVPPGKFFFALEVFPFDGNTGFAGDSVSPTQQNGPPPSAPAPGSVVMLASAALCFLPLGFAAWRRKKLAAV